MSNEISMALAIIDSPQALEVLKKEVEAAGRASQPNSNTNSVGNPIR
jgi:hypothetical protein